MNNINVRKIPYKLSLLLLTSGASLILGFLSFGGMFVLWPILPLAFSAFVLSVAYEGEIYLQNIKGALNKLFKKNHLQRQFANDYLLNQFPDTSNPTCPEFFKDYEAQLNLLHQFGHVRLDRESLARKKRIEKTLRDMEKWFATQLFSDNSNQEELTPYEHELSLWLATHQQAEWQARFKQREWNFKGVKIFSVLSGLFMGVGTTYLLVEAFAAIPLLSALSMTTLPFIIIPMAMIAGAAYGLLTYNAITDMITNDTFRKWYNKLRQDWSQGLSLRNVFMAVMVGTLVALAIGLTICTAGTWWTVVKETRPLFAWMGKMPGFIMGIINPLITGLSAVVFNLQNTSESLELIEEATHSQGHFFSRMTKAIRQGFHQLQARENWLQILNPFRLVLTLTITPLRILLFFGHLISIGVTADRVPGVSQIFSALLGIISEGFEDAHYFFDHDHPEHDHHDHHDHDHDHDHDHHHEHRQDLLQERLSLGHGHNHDLDLPTRLLKLVFIPVYLLAASWDFATSKMNTNPRRELSFKQAWEKQNGLKEEQSVEISTQAPRPSSAWSIEHALYRIEHHKEKHLDHASVNRDIAIQKSEALTNLQGELRRSTVKESEVLLRTLENKPVYNQHRLFANGPTRTAKLIAELPHLVEETTAAPVSCA